MSRLSTLEKDLLKKALIRHQVKNPGCTLSHKRCIFETSKECIGKGAADKFHGRMCHPCRSVYNRQSHALRVGGDPDKPRSVGRPRKEA